MSVASCFLNGLFVGPPSCLLVIYLPRFAGTERLIGGGRRITHGHSWRSRCILCPFQKTTALGIPKFELLEGRRLNCRSGMEGGGQRETVYGILGKEEDEL